MLPPFRVWRRRHLKALQEYRRPEHWGIHPDAPLVRAIAPAAESHVLLAGATEPGPALYLAAHGCAVTAVERQYDVIDRVVSAAEAAGLTQHVRGCVTDFRSWEPDAPLNAVVYSPGALTGLDARERGRVISRLQSATTQGGVHLVDGAAFAASADVGAFVEELHAHYSGWRTRLEHCAGAFDAFLAHKAVA